MPGLVEAFERAGVVLEHHMPLLHAPGAALAVTDPDETLGVVVRGFADVGSSSPVRPQTRFQIGSISKSFAGILAMQEVDAGRLDLHAPVLDLLPWLELRQPFGPITLHHLLTHSSGLAIGTEHAGDAVVQLRRRAEVDPGFAPGERFSYSNDGYKIVGLVLESVTGIPFPELVRQRVLEPLGMTHTSGSITPLERLDIATGYVPLFDDRPPHREHPLVPAPWIDSATADGSIVSDVLDMAAYARILLGRGRGPAGARVLSDEAFERVVTPHVRDQDDPVWSYGYGVFVGIDPADGRRTLRHSGGMVGYTALLVVDVEARLAGVLLLNGDGARDAIVRDALGAVRAALAGEPLPSPIDAPDPVRIPEAPALAGRYTGIEGAIELVAQGEGLLLRDGEVEVGLEFDPPGPPGDVFLVPHPERDRYPLRLERDAAGGVVAVTHGPDRFVRGDDPPEDRPLPDGSEAFCGHYRSPNPWSPSLRVYGRDGRLWLAGSAAGGTDAELELRPDGGASFVVGTEPWRCERITFELIVDGRAARAVFDGAPYARSFMP